MSTLNQLISARALIVNADKHTSKAYAVNNQGREVPPASADACKWDKIGALFKWWAAAQTVDMSRTLLPVISAFYQYSDPAPTVGMFFASNAYIVLQAATKSLYSRPLRDHGETQQHEAALRIYDEAIKYATAQQNQQLKIFS